MCGGRGFMGSLYLSLNFAVNQELCKNKSSNSRRYRYTVFTNLISVAVRRI